MKVTSDAEVDRRSKHGRKQGKETLEEQKRTERKRKQRNAEKFKKENRDLQTAEKQLNCTSQSGNSSSVVSDR